MAEPRRVPEAGDIVWTDFDAVPGRARKWRRPALVVSPAAFNRASGFAIVCPIAEGVRHFGSNVALPAGLPVAGDILTAHVRSLDSAADPLRHAGAAVPAATLAEVRGKLAVLCGIHEG